MSAAQGRGEIRRLLGEHEHKPNKRLGQHFLADPNLVQRIVTAARVGPGDRVVEIGAGTGTLTRALAGTGARVVAYEIDEHLRPLLEETLAGSGAEVRFADATAVDLGAELGEGPWTLVANLPYNVGTPLVLEVLRHVPAVQRQVVMVQREVADRLAAGPGSRVYGLPSVVASLYGRARTLFTVPPSVFVPAPDVESAVVEVTRDEPPEQAAAAVHLAGAAFAQRRKMLRNSLGHLVTESQLREAGIDPGARPETLAPGDFVRLAEALAVEAS